MNYNQTFIFYIVISVLSVLSMREALTFKKKNNKFGFAFFLSLSFLILFLVNVLRGENVGTDYINTGNYYTSIVNFGGTNSSYNWFGKPLTLLCILLGKIFGSNRIIFFTFIGFFTILFMYKFFIECCKFPTLSLILYLVFCLYLQSFNQCRQMLALSIVLYSLKYIEKDDVIKYCLFILLASVFHASALIFLPLFLLKKIKINKKTILIYIIISVLLIGPFGILEGIIGLTKYKIYFTTQFNVSGLTRSYFNLVFRIILMLIVFLFKKKLSDDEKNNYLYNIAIICTILQGLTVKYYFLGRLTTYFYAFYIALLPEILNQFVLIQRKNLKLFAIFCIIILLSSYYYIYYNSSSGAIGSGYSNYDIFLNNNLH